MDFQTWLTEIDRLAADEGCNGSYTRQTGHDCWREAFDDGMSPAEAWAEEKSAGAECA